MSLQSQRGIKRLRVMHDADVIVIGSGIGGLVAGALLARYGRQVLVCESHSIPGGAAHSFSRQGFQFDSGPSFYCGLSDRHSLNPLRQVLDALGESIAAIPYDPMGHYHFPDGTFPVYGNADRYRAAIARITPSGAEQFARLEQRLLSLYEALREIPTLALRADLNLIPVLLSRYSLALLKLLPQLGVIQGSVGDLMDQTVRDHWVRRLIDLECFLLSGLKAHGTIAPEVAFMFGERSHSVIDYPVGGSGAIVQALVRGLERWGSKLRLNAHVEEILVGHGKAVGIRLKQGETLKAPIVISNATLWDTYTKLLKPEHLPADYRRAALATPAVDSFMHLHLGIRADGLEGLTGHHVVVHSAERDITEPGNTCMISIPSVWDASLAPAGHHVVHAYTLEPYANWQRSEGYEAQKQERSQSLFQAVERVIPNARSRITLELIGTPLTHARFLRRHQGTYGPAIAAGQGMFPGNQTPIPGLYRVGDSTMPGIGVPAVAASGILCANTLVKPQQTAELLS
jgi:carotene isomerase